MVKAQFSIRIDVDIWEKFQELYPRKVSPIVEEHLRGIIETETNKQISREEIKSQILTVKTDLSKLEREERNLEKQLTSYDTETERKKDLLESEESNKKRDNYFKLPMKNRAIFGEICTELNELKVKNFGFPVITFLFYYEINEEIKTKLFEIAEKNNYFKLNSLLLRLNSLQNQQEIE